MNDWGDVASYVTVQVLIYIVAATLVGWRLAKHLREAIMRAHDEAFIVMCNRMTERINSETARLQHPSRQPWTEDQL